MIALPGIMTMPFSRHYENNTSLFRSSYLTVRSSCLIFPLINTFPMYAVLPFIISVNFAKFDLLLISIHLFSLQMLLFHPSLIIAIVFFYGLPDTSIKRLQRVQNSLARVIFPSLKRSNHITPALVKLHWLPIHKR